MTGYRERGWRGSSAVAEAREMKGLVRDPTEQESNWDRRVFRRDGFLAGRMGRTQTQPGQRRGEESRRAVAPAVSRADCVEASRVEACQWLA